MMINQSDNMKTIKNIEKRRFQMAKVDFNYYALYLKKYLVDNDDPRKDDAEFINDRADLAGQEYESNRLNGLEVFQAEELAMEVLMSGL